MPLDIGVGLMLGLLVQWMFHLPDTALFPLAGVVFALLPDIDYLAVALLKGLRQAAEQHRNYLHLPLLYVPVGVGLLLPLGVEWSVLFALCSLAHLLHDSIGIGWGIQWLFPFKDDAYTFLYRVETNPNTSMRRRWVYVWPKPKLPALVARYGDEDWIRNIYLRLHPYAIIEGLVLLIGVLVVVFG